MWDLFISHASEDKESVARPLYEQLVESGYSVWFDEATLKLGDSLRQKIDEGLSQCKFGVVIISQAFLQKEWPQRELDALVSREYGGYKVILPVWHKITREELTARSPLLSGKLAVSSELGISTIVNSIRETIGEPENHSVGKESELLNVLASSKYLNSIYIKLCEGEELLEEFCNDVINFGSFQISTSRILSEGIIPETNLNRILKNLANVFHKKHQIRLFQLACTLYDKVSIDDSLFIQIQRRGLDNSQFSELSDCVPRKSSLRLSRIFFNAFLEIELGPTRFSTACCSPGFAKYCGIVDAIRTRDLMLIWSKSPYFSGPIVDDAIYCAKLIAEQVGIDGEFRCIRSVVKRWIDDKLIWEELRGSVWARENAKVILGYSV